MNESLWILLCILLLLVLCGWLIPQKKLDALTRLLKAVAALLRAAR